jgi:hypothetical protein
LSIARQGGRRLRTAQESVGRTQAVRKQHGADLAVFSGETSGTLTMPASCIVASDGTVEHADINVDYTGRGGPSELFPFSPLQDSVEPLPQSERDGRPASIQGSGKRVRASQTAVIRFQAVRAGGNLEGTR